MLPIVLASRSPRRLELLQSIIPASRILVHTPPSAAEKGFEGLKSLPEVFRRVLEIAQEKHDRVAESLHNLKQPYAAIIAGDTVVVVSGLDEMPVVLGQPPDSSEQNELVRRWFHEYYAGREHQVLTGVCISGAVDGVLKTKTFLVTTLVRFANDVDRWLEWYLETGEPRGKAGGYAIQGAGSLFVEQVTGSLSNVIGLPIREVKDTLAELGIDPIRNGK
ncbi:MAG: yhdE [Planctomycetaceae bacterium]|nr:yhdE [Planctomycetaceae bacterium]